MIDRLNRLGRFVARVVARFAEESLDQTSASLAYTTLLSIVPLVAVVLGAMSAMPSFLSMVDQLDSTCGCKSCFPKAPVYSSLRFFSGGCISPFQMHG